jgi:beta-galactosidase
MGKALHYYLNYSSDPQTFHYWHGAGAELLSGRAISASQEMTLAPWDVAIVEER